MEIEDSMRMKKMIIYLDGNHFILDSNNPQCMINVWKNKVYIDRYTHIESFLFDLENVYCGDYKSFNVSVIPQRSNKRKRD